jgi:signal transduction histidine kinase
VPLVFELLLCIGLFFLVRESEITAAKASRTRQIYSLINATLSDSLNFVRILEKVDFFDTDLESLMNGQIENLTKAQNKLIELTGNEPEYREMLNEYAERTNELKRAYAVMMPLYKEKEWGKLLVHSIRLRRYYKNLLTKGDSVDRWKAMAHEDVEEAEREPKLQAELREKIKLVLAAGVIVSIISTVWLALFFSKQISGRLEIMAANNKRFTQHEALLPQVPGSDEIADLDRGFHNMAKEMEAAQRLRNQVVAMVTHDLRTPLSTVGAFIDHLNEDSLGKEEKRLREIAERNISRMSELINDLLELEKLQSGTLLLDRSTFSLAEAAHEAKEVVTVLLNKKNLQVKVAGDCQVNADKRRIVQVISNLLGNAAKFSRAETEIKVSIQEEGEMARIEISDTGEGISQEKLDVIFEPFQQAGSKAGGSGLGLAICKALLRAHDGDISVKSQLGAGSIFVFKIPRGGPSVA